VPNYKKANWEGIKQDLISSRDKFIAKFESGTNMDTIEENWKQFKEAKDVTLRYVPPAWNCSSCRPVYVSTFMDYRSKRGNGVNGLFI
jgi:hypothetical protein